jgi:GT2 family glycosyltransferase
MFSTGTREKEMFVSVIICTCNRCQSLRDTLESLAAQTADRSAFEVIVVDNHSEDATRETVQEMAGRGNLTIRYLYEGRRGKAYALEAGVVAAKGQILAFTDDDVIVGPAWIENILKAFTGRRIACLGGRIRPLWLCEKPQWYDRRLSSVIVEYDRGDQFTEIKKGTLPFGANFILSADVLKKYGGFSLDLASGTFMRCEDTELVKRLLAHGEPVYYSPDVIVHHKVTSERMTKRFFRNWFYAYGMAISRMQRIQRKQEPVRWTMLDVPWWRYRKAAMRLFHAAREGLKRNAAESFYLETKFWTELGFIVDRWRGGESKGKISGRIRQFFKSPSGGGLGEDRWP